MWEGRNEEGWETGRKGRWVRDREKGKMGDGKGRRKERGSEEES